MNHHPCGRSGLALSQLGLGTMTFGHESDEPTAHRMLDTFVDAGGTFIDTADVYTAGASEEMIGRWISARRGHQDLVIATKGRMPMREGPLNKGAGRRHLTRALDASLRRLGTDHVDLYQVHAWDPATPIAETLDTLDGFTRAGKVRYTGWSNVTGWQLQKILATADARGLARPVSLQPQYSLLDRGIELEILPQCVEEGVGVLPWGPLGGGWLTGKYQRGQPPTGASRLGEDPNRGLESWDARNTDQTWAVLDIVRDIATGHGVQPAQVALAWLAQRPGVTSIILGARNVEQLQGNLASTGVQLTAEEITSLTKVSAPGIPPYPYGFMTRYADDDTWDRLGTR